MMGWAATGREVKLHPNQAHAVLVLLGQLDPDEQFDAFWRLGRAGGKTTALVTAGRYAQAEGEYNEIMYGLHADGDWSAPCTHQDVDRLKG